MTHPLARAVAAAVAGLVSFGALAGCGGDDVSPSRESAETTAAAAATATTRAGATLTTAASDGGPTTSTVPVSQETRAEILLLEGAQLDGQQFDLAAAAGNDVLLWFWAPW